MPYNDAQVRLFQMIKHGKLKRKGLSSGKAAKMLTEAGDTHKSGNPKGGGGARALVS